jgi:hypothetical protein
MKRRSEIFDWITRRPDVTVQMMDKPDYRSSHAAWRVAEEASRRRHRLSVNGKVSPH